MQLAIRAPLILSANIQRMAVDRSIRKCVLMSDEDFFGDDIQTDALNA